MKEKREQKRSIFKSEGTKRYSIEGDTKKVTWEKADQGSEYVKLHVYTGTKTKVTGIQRNEVSKGRRGDLQETTRRFKTTRR